jgi:hypothetical protein
MHKPNKKHLQPPLISNVQELPAKHRQRLEHSWAGEFYREFFCRLKEEPFANLYADHPSRPNIPVNVLVSLDVLKAGFGWSDEELYDHFTFDIQVRYAVGYHNLNEGDFDIRTLYNFRRRLSQYNLEHCINLVTEAFESITDQQVIAFKVKTNQQRMDSTQVASNILDSSRLQLAAEALQRTYRMLSEADQAHYFGLLEPYLKDTTNQYIYRIKGKEEIEAHLTEMGRIMHQLICELKASYADAPFFPVLERFFGENFRIEGESSQLIAGKELASGCLQSLDDLEASYRQKGSHFYKGYVVNVTETCNPENELQLITQVQTAPNNQEDTSLLIDALPALARRTDLKQLFTDGAYGSPAVDQALGQQAVELIQSAIRGTHLAAGKLHLSEYEIRQDEQGAPIQITCPNRHTTSIQPTPSKRSLLARFDASQCDPCPFHLENRCRVFWRKRCGKFQMDFTLQEVNAARRRRSHLQHKKAPKNLRAAIEATMRCIKHPFPAGKLPVRGLFRVMCLMVGSAAMVNIRSICRYRQAKLEHPASNRSGHELESASEIAPLASFSRSIRHALDTILAFFRPARLLFGF